MKKAIFMTVAVVLFACSATLFAAEKAKAVQKLTGEVVKVDAKAGSITIKADGKEHALKAEAKLLEGVNAGDKVEVEVAGSKVKSIKKVEAPAPAAPAPAAPAPAPQQAPK
jgi:Cu/Ag efflux protein CusF